MNVSIVKVGGAVVESPGSLGAFLDSFARIPGAKILVHGGGRSATEIAGQLAIPTTMIGGRRVTDGQMLRVVTMVYGGLVNKNIVAALQGRGVNAAGLTGADMGCILSHRRPPVEVGGEVVDYGFVGDICEVRTAPLRSLLEAGMVPVVAPLTLEEGAGTLLNTNADGIASAVAVALSAQAKTRLVYCFEKKGVLADPSDEDSVIPEIRPEDFTAMKVSGAVSGGMLPKLENAFSALEKGVGEVVITSAANLGGGTRISL